MSEQTQNGEESIAFPRRRVRQGWLAGRRNKVVTEIERNRRGDYTVPTWVLAMGIVAILLVWVVIVIYA